MPKAWEEIVPNCVQNGVPTIKCLEAVFYNILKVAVSLVSLTLFLILLIGGFKYLTSGGDPKQTESARNTMTYAIVGLVVIVGTFLIFKAIEHFTGLPLTKFEIPTYSP